MIAMRVRWLGNGLVIAGLTLCSTANAQNAQNAPPRNDLTRVVAKRQDYKLRVTEEKPLSKALIPPAIIAGLGITGFMVSGIIYEYATDKLYQVHNCHGATCPQDLPIQAQMREYRQGTTAGMVSSGLVFGVGLIWFAILAPNANTSAPPKASIVPVITPNGVFLNGRF